MSAKIRILDDDTVNKISAGEVIERPASIVKELIENALDAGAMSVSVTVEEGGRKSVSVRDDGCGLSPEDSRMAFESHATSKISDIRDLDSLISYGFRGEALSSIAAVSRVTLRTREHDSDSGTETVVHNGRVVSSGSVGCPPGTEVLVEEIFGNVPARRKSLKSKGIELGHCREVLVNYVLCRAGLSFSFRSDGSTDIVHVPAEGMKGSLVVAFGSKVADHMMFGEAERDGLRVEAYLARLEHTRSSPGDIRLFVNDRPIRSTKLISAIVAGYGSKLMKDRYPIGAVRIFLDSSALDVNVHPSKREVRFEDEAAVSEAVEECVSKALDKPDLSFKFDLTRFSEVFTSQKAVEREDHARAVQIALDIPEKAKEESLAIVPLAQIMNTYILAESRGNLLLVDQHAASERVVYESLLRSIEDGKEISQALLTPLVVRLTSSEERVMEENRGTLEKAGFGIEPFGKNALALRSIPTVLGVAQGESAFRNLLGDLGQMAPQKKLGLEVIWRVACHTAIRAGDPLSQGQMRQLVSDLIRTESPFTCEHGRPTMVVLSPTDLEKLFKRRV